MLGFSWLYDNLRRSSWRNAMLTWFLFVFTESLWMIEPEFVVMTADMGTVFGC